MVYFVVDGDVVEYGLSCKCKKSKKNATSSAIDNSVQWKYISCKDCKPFIFIYGEG